MEPKPSGDSEDSASKDEDGDSKRRTVSVGEDNYLAVPKTMTASSSAETLTGLLKHTVLHMSGKETEATMFFQTIR